MNEMCSIGNDNRTTTARLKIALNSTTSHSRDTKICTYKTKEINQNLNKYFNEFFIHNENNEIIYKLDKNESGDKNTEESYQQEN